MATSKVKQKAEAQEEILQEENLQEAVPEVKEQKALDPWEQKVVVNIPRATNGEPNYIIASVNQRVFKVKRGENVAVPLPIAEVLNHSFQAEDEAIAFIESAAN